MTVYSVYEPSSDAADLALRADRLAFVKEAIRSVTPRFAARRMVKEYAERMYAPSLASKVAR